MQAVEEKLAIKVVKRDGKKVDFDASKIAIAIKKGFDSITDENDELVYDSKDAKKKDTKMYINHFLNIEIEDLNQENYSVMKKELINSLKLLKD